MTIQDYVQAVKNEWTTLKVFEHFQWHANGTRKEGNEIRLCGHGGLLINGDRWHTFAGGAGGGPVEAWYYCQRQQEMPQSEFMATVYDMGDAAGIQRPVFSKEDQKRHDERRSIEAVFALAAAFYHAQLPDAQREHLNKHYGLTDETINRYKIGYAPTGDSALFNHLRNEHKIAVDDLTKTGLFREHNGRWSDVFQGRIVFPYWNRGSVVYFNARLTDNTPEWERKAGMKYCKLLVHNDSHPYVSPEVTNGHLLGEDEVRGKDETWIVEGITDWLAAVQQGLPAVSPATTTFRSEDIDRMVSLVNDSRVFIVNDNEVNGAGRKGALATAKALWESGSLAKLVELPRPDGADKVDLNEYLLTHTADHLRALCGSAQTLLDISVQEVKDAKTQEDKVVALKNVFHLIAYVQDEFVLAHWQDTLPKELGIKKGPYKEFVKAARQEIGPVKGNDDAKAKAAAASLQQVKASGLPMIIENNRQLRDVLTDSVNAVSQYNVQNQARPILYARNGVLTRIARVSRDDGDEYKFNIVDTSALDGVLSQVADWVHIKEDRDGNEFYLPVYPPTKVSAAYIGLGEWDGTPTINAIVNAPTFSRNGELHDKPGYNAQTRLFYTGGVTLGDTDPTPKRVQWAKSMIFDELFTDFPFADQASKAHAAALFILGFVRPMIAGPTPLHVIRAPEAGTGKGLLTEVACFPALGRSVPSMQYVSNEEEIRKALTALRLEGASHINIDNANTQISSASLNTALTSAVWTDRQLGVSHMPSLHISSIFVANGNNVSTSKEVGRRSILIHLDANLEHPSERTQFKHENLTQWAREHRDELATAAIVLVKNWIAKGKPAFQGKAKGSFEEWTKTVGGILQAAGIDGMLENDEKLRETPASTDETLRTFAATWLAEYGSGEIAQPELFKIASVSDNDNDNRTGEWKNILGEMLPGRTQRSREMRFGDILRDNTDRVFDGYKLVFCGKVNGRWNYWKLDPVGNVQPPPPVVKERLHVGDVTDPKFGEVERLVNGKVTAHVNGHTNGDNSDAPPWDGKLDVTPILQPTHIDANGDATWILQ